MKEYKAMASICDGELKCACAKEVCMTCECREHFHCQEAIVQVIEKTIICKINNVECGNCIPVCDKKVEVQDE